LSGYGDCAYSIEWFSGLLESTLKQIGWVSLEISDKLEWNSRNGVIIEIIARFQIVLMHTKYWKVNKSDYTDWIINWWRIWRMNWQLGNNWDYFDIIIMQYKRIDQ